MKLLITVLLAITAGGVFAQEKVELGSATYVDVRVISTLNKKAKKEKFIAFMNAPVMSGGKVLIAGNAPVAVKVKKTGRSDGRRSYTIRFLSVQAVDGQRIRLSGSLAKVSREVTRREKLEMAAVNVAWAPFGYLPTETLPKKLRTSEMTVVHDVFVEGNYRITTGK